MAQEWYLMNTDHDTVSGFESEDFNGMAADAFAEALESAIAIDVELCNYDLSERQAIRVVMERNVQDTKLNSLSRNMLSKIGTCHAGQYIYYKNRYWLITGLVDDNGLYEKSVLSLCNYLLTWQTDDGRIAQRWASVQSASQYNNGETAARNYYLRSDQVLIMIPDDDDSISIPHGQRFIIDSRTKVYEKYFDSNVIIETSKKLITYQLTRMDNVLYNYQDSGHCQFLATQDEKHEKDGYYLIDGTGYWLCIESKPEKQNEVPATCSIECDEPVVYCGFGETIFTPIFFGADGNKVDATPQWEINCDFNDSLIIEYVENSICISTDNDKLIDNSFELSLSADGYEETSIQIMIKAFF